MKKAICICCAAIMLFLTGCGSKKTDSEIIQEYLHDKYNKDFVVLNTTSSATGSTPFSYHLWACCVPADDPECLFEVQRSVDSKRTKMQDFYCKGILNRKAAVSLEEKLSPYFEGLYVSVDIQSTKDVILDNMEDLTYDLYFSAIDPDYKEHPDELPIVQCDVGLNLDKKRLSSYDTEFDVLYQALAELSEKMQVNAQMNLILMHDKSFQIYEEWFKDHTYGFPSWDEFSYHFIYFAYDVQKDELGSTIYHTEPVTKEEYVAKRKKIY